MDVGAVATHTLISRDRLEAIRTCVLSTCALPGVMAELGVYRGGSARLIAACCSKKPLHLFDTFAGIPENDQFNEGHRQGDFACSLSEVSDALAGYNVYFHPGTFPMTATDCRYEKFSFVHIDADIYQSTCAAIDFFWPRMTPHGLIVFDDYKWPHCPGVEQAILERNLSVQVIAEYQCVVSKPEGRNPMLEIFKNYV